MGKRKTVSLTLCMLAAFFLSSCGSEDYNVQLAFDSIRDNDLETADVRIEAAVEQEEDPQLIARARGVVSMGRGKYDEAIQYFEEAISFAGPYVSELEFDISYYLMAAQEKAGYLDDATETCSAILGLRPLDSQTWFMRGRINLENDKYDDALRDFNRAIDTSDSGPDIYIDIFEFLEKEGYKEAANDYLARAMSLPGKMTDLQKGRLAFCRGDYDTARDYLEKARSEKDEGVIIYLGRTYEALNDYNFAASLYTSYNEKHPEDLEILNQLGLCKMVLGEYEEALAAFEKGLESGGGDMKESLEFNRIVACERLGDFKKALKLIKKYTAAWPHDEKGQREQEFLTQWERFGSE